MKFQFLMLAAALVGAVQAGDPNLVKVVDARGGGLNVDAGAEGDCKVDNNTQSQQSASLYAAPVPARRLDSVGSEMGEPQVIDVSKEYEIFDKIKEARYYMNNVVNVESRYDTVRHICKNQHENCAFWAVLGECENNPAYMKMKCAPVCQSCDYVSIEARCPLDPEAVDAWYPGDITKMFERLMSDPELKKYEPKIVSRPNYMPGDTAETADYIIGPWMAVLENMLTEEEAHRMIDLGGIEGYKRSADVGDRLEDGTYSQRIYGGRTSENAWCQTNCYDDPVAVKLMETVENITGIPEPNSEWLQLLRYEVGQFYNTHNDYIPYQRERQSGVRILTFYFYLNDVEEGGGTNFPNLDLTVTPKRGRAVMWPSVYDNEPNEKDPRSDHQALPVIKGTKYGANAWVHQRDFKSPHKTGCN